MLQPQEVIYCCFSFFLASSLDPKSPQPFTNKLVCNYVRSWWINPNAQDQQETVLMTGIKRSSGLQPKAKLPLLWTCQVPENPPNNSSALVLILRAEEALIKIYTEGKLLLKTDPFAGTNWKLSVKEEDNRQHTGSWKGQSGGGLAGTAVEKAGWGGQEARSLRKQVRQKVP